MEKLHRFYSISVIRLLACIMIISCHILQYYGNELAWWLNVGVQIFLLISAFLYGQKEVSNPLSFYKKNFIKILVDYYLFLLFVIPFYLYFTELTITIKMWLKLICGFPILLGLNHLWYISTILFCYLLIPLLFYFTKQKYKYIYFIVLMFVVQILCSLHILPFTGAWINCFIIGYILGGFYKNFGKSVIIKILNLSLPIALMLNISKIYLKYFIDIDITRPINLFYQYAHVFLAIFMFSLLLLLLQKVNFGSLMKNFLNFTDKITYDIYITHHIFILGSFSLLVFGKIYIIVIILLTIVSSFGLFYLSRYVKDKIFNIIDK